MERGVGTGNKREAGQPRGGNGLVVWTGCRKEIGRGMMERRERGNVPVLECRSNLVRKDK
jgi:hypothetical protein